MSTSYNKRKKNIKKYKKFKNNINLTCAGFAKFNYNGKRYIFEGYSLDNNLTIK